MGGNAAWTIERSASCTEKKISYFTTALAAHACTSTVVSDVTLSRLACRMTCRVY